MSTNVFEPFNEDVADVGGYVYTSTTKRSCLRANRRNTDELIATARPAGLRLLDVGCGDGAYTVELYNETQVAHVTGIDPAADAIAVAQRRIPAQDKRLTFQTGLADSLLGGEPFDIAIYRGVLHHTADPASEIATGMRLARRLLILEPNGWNPILKCIERLSPYHRAHAERSFTSHRYCRWVAAAGGKVTAIRYFGLVPFFCPDWMVSIGIVLEPIVERIPGLRTLACGQMLIDVVCETDEA